MQVSYPRERSEPSREGLNLALLRDYRPSRFRVLSHHSRSSRRRGGAGRRGPAHAPSLFVACSAVAVGHPGSPVAEARLSIIAP